ncbi:hypothetical protein C8R45DRAFT_842622 [Mycena sanguinolenta]|nr:hypothetical protein C8R45DRAFT_842622 [Mycena sanguinolenta]
MSAPESMEHILLECEKPGRREVWRLTESLWQLKFSDWPKMNWGLLLRCGLARFWSSQGKILPAKNRLFPIVVSISMRIIGYLRNQCVFETHSSPSEQEINSHWVSMMNATLRQDQLLTNTARFGDLAIKKQLVLNTWGGTLFDEDSLPDDWTKTKGVLVGIQLITREIGVG